MSTTAPQAWADRCAGLGCPVTASTPALLALRALGDLAMWLGAVLIVYLLISFIRRNRDGVLLLSGAATVRTYYWIAASFLLGASANLIHDVPLTEFVPAALVPMVQYADALLRCGAGVVFLCTGRSVRQSNVAAKAVWESPERVQQILRAVTLLDQALVKLERTIK